MADGEDARPDHASLHARLPLVDPVEAGRRNGWLKALNTAGLAAELSEPSSAPALRFSDVVWITPDRIDGAPAVWLKAAESPALPEALAAFSRLEPLLEALERAMARPLDPQAIEQAPTGLTLWVAHGDHAARIMIGPGASPPPSRADRRVPAGGAANATIPCRLVMQGPLAPASELSALAPGDLVMAASSPDGIKGWLSAPGVGTVAGRLSPGSARFLCEGMMDSTKTPETADAAPAGDLPGGLKVRLRLELGSLEVTLADLAALASGAVLPVPALNDAPVVTITAPGATLATGRLVALGETGEERERREEERQGLRDAMEDLAASLREEMRLVAERRGEVSR